MGYGWGRNTLNSNCLGLIDTLRMNVQQPISITLFAKYYFNKSSNDWLYKMAIWLRLYTKTKPFEAHLRWNLLYIQLPHTLRKYEMS